MHEHSFIQAIIRDIENSSDVIAIEIELGDLVGIDAEHLKEHLVEETRWKVIVKEKKSLVRCSCGYTGKAKIQERLHDLVIFECPKCGNIPEVLEGKDIKILKVFYK